MANYCVRADIEAVFGVNEVAKWADLDEDEDATKIATRITAGCTWATAEIDDLFRRSRYVIQIADEDDAVPTTIVHLSATLAGVWLYENRGVLDYDPDTGKSSHRLAYNRDRAYKIIEEIKAGVRDLDAVKTTGVEELPVVVDSTDWNKAVTEDD